MQQFLITKQPNKLRKLLLPAVLGCLAVSAWFFLKPATLSADQYLLQQVKAGEMTQQMTGLGVIHPRQKNVISAPVNAHVTEINVRSGQKVVKTEKLFSLANYELEQEYEKSKYDLVHAQANVAVRAAELKERSYQLQSQLDRARAEYQKLKLELDARRVLLQSGIVSKIHFMQSELSAEQANSEVGSLTQQLASFRQSHTQQLEALQSQLKASQQRTAFLKSQIEKLHFYAEADGIVNQLNLNKGQSVQQGQLLMELVETEHLVARVQLPQHSAQWVQTGQKAIVKSTFGEIEAVIEHIDPIIRNGALQVDLKLAQHSLPLAVDQDIEAFIFGSQKKQGFVVNRPSEFKNDGSWKTYIKRGDRLVQISLTIDDRDQTVLFIQNSVTAGDQLVFMPASLAQQQEYRIHDDS